VQGQDWLAEQFEENRGHLRGVAYRILGSVDEADDAVQEAWLRLSRSDSSEIENLGGWLTTVVSRVCLDILRSRKSRREESMEAQVAEPAASGSADPVGQDPQQRGPALMRRAYANALHARNASRDAEQNRTEQNRVLRTEGETDMQFVLRKQAREQDHHQRVGT